MVRVRPPRGEAVRTTGGKKPRFLSEPHALLVRLYGVRKDDGLCALTVAPAGGVAVIARGGESQIASGVLGVVQRHPAKAEDERNAMTMADSPEAWLCTQLEPRLIGTLTLYCGDPLVAEELAQETLVRLLDRWGQVQHMASPAAWAHRVAINLANSRFRRLRAERRARQRLEGHAVRAQSDDMHGVDMAAHIAVREAVSRLPKRQRTALVLRYYADLPVTEVATLMECSPGTVKSLTHHAIGALRQAGLVERYDEVRDG
jgi:RNA polymerase sigma factor (sigma-70 family)